MAQQIPPNLGVPPVGGAVPAAPPAGAVHLPAVAVPPPRTYRELYSDAAHNPRMDRTGVYLAGYRFTDVAGNVPAPAALRDQTIALSDRQPMAFLALIAGQDGAYEVVVVHRLVRYLDAPGDDPSGLHDRVLGLMGDILPHQYPTVEVPGTAFHLVGNAARVPTTAAMTALIPTWDDNLTPVLGPYTEADPETEVIRTRHIQLVPGRYAALLVHRRRVRPKQAYQELVGAIEAHNELAACQDVVAWLKAACTARGGGGAQNTAASVVHAFAPLHLPPEAYRYVTSKVQADLPAIAGGPAVGGGGTTDPAVAGALQALGLARALEGGEAAAGVKPPKTILEAYKETHTTLLRFCNANSPDTVAPVWLRLANCHKSEQHTVLTQELQKVCMARGLATEIYTPVITTTLKQMITGLQFAGHGIDDLSTGCQPFLVSYSGGTDYYASLAAASVGHQLAQGEQSASLADYRSLREQEKVKFPKDFLEVYITLARYAVLCQGLFQGPGAKHPFVEAMWAVAVAIHAGMPLASERLHQLARLTPAIVPTDHARIVRAVQVAAQEYLQQVAISVANDVSGVEVPNFQALLRDLRQGSFHLSTNWLEIPEAYLDPIVMAPTPSVGSLSAPSGTASSGSTSRSGISMLTGNTQPRMERVDNPSRDTEFASITIRPGGTRPVLRDHPPPRNDAGNEFCVVWWTRGGCFPNCRRRDTHLPFASAGERTRLLTFVRTHLQAPAAAAGASA